MNYKIKEKILKEIEDNLIYENRSYDERDIKRAIEETSKAKDKEFINILNDLQDDVDALQIHRANLDECEKVDVWELIEEIKQKIKEKEEWTHIKH